ncbi:MAG: hypothetical protein ACRD3M_12820 [Thermoanaerobaculia bacterium]
MIAFASLFLGLMVGVRPVTVIVGEPVAAVAFELDGRAVGRLTGAPWTLEVDFGREFEPHELVARAFDEKGGEVALTRQWVNLPRPPAEVEILLDRSAEGQAVGARLAWESVLGTRPDRISVTFDGRPLVLDENRRVSLPAYDPETTHVLTVSLEYPNDVRSRSDVVLGGGSAGEAKSELTAVPIKTPRAKAPEVEALRGRFSKKGEPLAVVAVERGPAEVILVRDLDCVEALRHLRRFGAGRSMPDGFGMPGRPGARVWTDQTALELEDRVRILWPVARPVAESVTASELFDASREFTGMSSGFRFLLTRVDYPGGSDLPRRFADAVALAGLRAFASYSRRAVVLVLPPSGRDESRYDPGAVRRYLERLHVPLYVWSFAEPSARAMEKAWGEAEDISSVAELERAVGKLRRDLDRQSIVWLEGRHLPQEIALADAGDGIAPAR